jgi:hypothetical protein
VIALDPYALAAMLAVTGPVQVDGLPEPLTTENAAQYLLRDQYLSFDQNTDRIDVLENAARSTFDAFIHAPSLRPSQLASVLGPMVSEGRLLAASTQPEEEALITRIGMDGAFPAYDQGDFFSLVTQNAGNNKIDVFLTRDIDYRATYNPATGAVDATATITLHNDAPSAGLPDYVISNRPSSKQPRGVNWVWFNFYSPHRATLDGRLLDMGTQPEFGLYVYHAFLAVPAKGQAKIELELQGSIAPASVYSLGWYQQPTVNTDHVRVTMHPVTPWTVTGPGGESPDANMAVIDRASRTDEQVRVDLAHPDKPDP